MAYFIFHDVIMQGPGFYRNPPIFGHLNGLHIIGDGSNLLLANPQDDTIGIKRIEFNNTVHSVAFSPCGEFVAVTLINEHRIINSVEIRSLKCVEWRKVIPFGEYNELYIHGKIAFSPDGDFLRLIFVNFSMISDDSNAVLFPGMKEDGTVRTWEIFSNNKKRMASLMSCTDPDALMYHGHDVVHELFKRLRPNMNVV